MPLIRRLAGLMLYTRTAPRDQKTPGARLGDCANLQWQHIDLISPIKTIAFDKLKTGAQLITVIQSRT